MREDPAAENNKKAASTPVTGKDLLDILLDKMEDDMAAEVTLTREKIKAFFIVRSGCFQLYYITVFFLS
jgi:hypothetical protein